MKLLADTKLKKGCYVWTAFFLLEYIGTVLSSVVQIANGSADSLEKDGAFID